jgi:glycosyltransferase involved in cell wall biosynthesis
METPIVATRHAGNAEGVAPGKSALLVDERDVDGLAQAIRFFCEDASAVAAFGKAGREFVEEKFDIRKRVKSLEQAYDRVRAGN